MCAPGSVRPCLRGSAQPVAASASATSANPPSPLREHCTSNASAALTARSAPAMSANSVAGSAGGESRPASARVGKVVAGAVLVRGARGRRLRSGRASGNARAGRPVHAEAGKGGRALRGDEQVGCAQQRSSRVHFRSPPSSRAQDMCAGLQTAVPRRAISLHRVARGRFDLHEGGAHFREAETCRRAGKVQGERDDVDAGERSGLQEVGERGWSLRL